MPWRSSAIVSSVGGVKRRNSGLESIPTTRNPTNDIPGDSSVTQNVENSLVPRIEPIIKKDKGGWNVMVTIVIVEAKGLPDAPDDGAAHGLYCKFRLGAQTFKSKSVLNSRHPQWRERFKLNLNSDPLLKISLWDKGKQKNFMGSCILDLSRRVTERTHDIWQELDGGYGSIHLSITMCNIRKADVIDFSEANVDEMRQKYAFYNLKPDLEVIGQLVVKVIGARGLSGKPNAYCTLTLDNEKVQTPCASSSSEPTWNKNYVFNIYDVTSVLELKVMDNSLNSFLNAFLGRASIPLLRIADGEARWYALKDANRRKGAKGNCPRVRLEMTMYWNPVTASLKLFRPKRVKYIQKQPKFDLALVYKNVKFVRETFDFLFKINESFKRLFEWDDIEYTYTALCGWMVFWYYFSPWMTPLLLLLPFLYFWYYEQKRHQELIIHSNGEDIGDHSNDEVPNDLSLSNKIQGLPEMTLVITDGIEYLVSVAERLFNLATFKVPFLSVLTMILLVGTSIVLYYIPFKYLMMAFGFYKFGRKQLNPERVLNNDVLDYISRIPDNKILKDWKELAVPEPQVERRPASI